MTVAGGSGGSGGRADATDGHNTTATIGTGSDARQIRVDNALKLRAAATETLTSDANGGNGGTGGVLNVALFRSTADSFGRISAHLGYDARVEAGTVEVLARSLGRTVDAGVDVFSCVRVLGDIEALIGKRAIINTGSTGSVFVEAIDPDAIAYGALKRGSGGVINVTNYPAISGAGLEGPGSTSTVFASPSRPTSAAHLPRAVCHRRGQRLDCPRHHRRSGAGIGWLRLRRADLYRHARVRRRVAQQPQHPLRRRRPPEPGSHRRHARNEHGRLAVRAGPAELHHRAARRLDARRRASARRSRHAAERALFLDAGRPLRHRRCPLLNDADASLLAIA